MRRMLPALFLVFTASLAAEPTNQFVVAAYNVENWNWIERDKKPHQPKPQAEKDAVVGVITTIRPDVLAIEEMGQTNDLDELTFALRAKGFDLPNREWIQASDPDRHVCLLTRFPIVDRRSRTDYTYLLDGKPMPVQRGFLDVRVKVNDDYSFRAIVAHLKSKRKSAQGDQAQMRLEEARLLRSHVGKALKDNRDENLIVMGDFNDFPDSEPLQAIVGTPPFALFVLPCKDGKGSESTHYWKFRNEHSHLDYLIASPGLSNEYVAGSARIADVVDWGVGSDHRMIYARFIAHDLGTVSAATSNGAFQLPGVLALVVGLSGILLWQRRSRAGRVPGQRPA